MEAPDVSFVEPVIESIPDGILILSSDRKTVTFNQEFVDLWKIPEVDIKSMKKNTILSDMALLLKNSDAFQEAKGSGFFELKDGRTIEGHSKPQTAGVVWSFSDVTKHKLEDRELRESDLRLRKIFESSALGILIGNISPAIAQGDLRGAEGKMNPAYLKMLGYSEEEFLKLGAKGITHPDDWESDLSLFLDLVAGKIDHYKIDKRCIRKDGSMIWVRLVVSLGEDVPGKPPFLVAMVDDITEIKNLIKEREVLFLAEHEAREKAEAALKLRDEFLAIASHELRTPLTPIKMLMSILKRDLAGETQRKLIQKIDHQIDRLIVLVEDLLDTSRMTRGRLTIHPEPCDLSVLVHEVTERYTVELLKAKCTLSLETQGEVKGQWDRLRIEQVVTNLLSNAIKYGAGKPIEIVISKEKDRARFTVRNYGIGIAKEDHENIFNRFTRAVPITNYGGLGLGLFISKQIVDAHQGSIRVESELGEGATFIVELPGVKT